MDSETFEKILNQQLHLAAITLSSKAKEYATEDRLHNFKTAAALKNETILQSIGGMMVKHTVSIYDMINSGYNFSINIWNEKITDHINYLILLRAAVDEIQAEAMISNA